MSYKDPQEEKSYNRVYYLENREIIRLRAKVYGIKNRESILLNKKEYYKIHQEEKKIYNNEYRIKNKEIISLSKKEYRRENKETISLKKKETYTKNKDRILSKRKEYYIKNKDSILLRRKSYCFNVEDRREYFRHYNLNKKQTDVQFKLGTILRSRLCTALKRNYKAGSAVRDLGCTIPELKFYLEGQFQGGMTWENHSRTGWHIDHKIPLDFYDLTDREQLLQAIHYTNLQPMWAGDNLRKGKKLI